VAHLGVPKNGNFWESGSFDLDRCEADPVSFLEDLVCRSGKAVDADQVVTRAGLGHTLSEELSDGSSGFDLDLIGEASPIVVDLC
jgi:hypothetical protein